ncbi:MAG: Mu transposase C-terminal domain-containing protein [Caenispirillum sp.]|nr:Mu transposase C-terminal domain-containing protein [Caenispirillum sp.]
MIEREWYTAAELAALALPGLPASERGMRMRADRDGWLYRERQGRGGGREFHVSGLPAVAKTKLVLAQAPKKTTAPQAAKADLSRSELWRWFEALPERKKAVAQQRLTALQSVETLYRTGVSKDVAVMTTARTHGVSASSLYNWFKLVEGRDRCDWLPALAPRHAGSTAQQAECSPEAWEFLKSNYLRAERRTFEACYDDLVLAAAEQGWAVPSCRTLRRRFDAEIPPAVVVMAREGVDAVKRMYPAQERDRAVFHALEAVNMDGHRWDVWVKWPDGEICRPNMVAIQDLYSGLFVAWRVDKSENREAVRLAIGDMVEEYGIPDHMYLDNGRGFASKWITGGTPTRYRFKVRDDEPSGLLTQLGVECHWTTPYSGQSKPIERGFRDFCDRIARHPAFAGAWTGNTIENKPENYGSKAVPLEDFLRIVGQGIALHNAREGRRTRTAAGRSFLQTFQESYAKSPIKRATDEQRRLWLLAAEGVTARAPDGSIHLMGNRYWFEGLHAFIGKRVVVRFDPQGLYDGVHVYRLDGAYVGRAECLEAVGFNDVQAAQEHSRKRRRWLKATREALELERTMKPDELAALLPDVEAPEPVESKITRPMFNGNAALKQAPKALAEQDEEQDEFMTAFAAGVVQLFKK